MDRGWCSEEKENDGQRLTQRYRRRIRVDVGTTEAMMKVDSERRRGKEQ